MALDEHLTYYLDNTNVSSATIDSRLIHPFTLLRYPARSVFSTLTRYANDFFQQGTEPRLLSLAGLRGVGKTTLLWQTADFIRQKGYSDIYFFNVNTLKTLGIDLHEALVHFQQYILKKRFSELTAPITLLFDEVHDDENWSRTLKIIYDEARSAFILCTGSSALLLNQTADLARRMHIEKVYPYKFTEFVAAKAYMEHEGTRLYPAAHIATTLQEALFFSATAEEALTKLLPLETVVQAYYAAVASVNTQTTTALWEHYLRYQHIPSFLFYKSLTAITQSMLDLVKRVILEDIPKLKPNFTDAARIERLVLRLAGSDEINAEKLAGLIGVKQAVISDIIDLLARGEILNVLMPYGGVDTKLLKNKKAFFMSPSLRHALLTTLFGQQLPEQFNSKLIEDIIVMYLRCLLPDGVISYASGHEKVNPDFVIETREMPIVLEVGKQKVSLAQFKKSPIKHRYGILITQAVPTPIVRDNCLQLPLSLFLLL